MSDNEVISFKEFVARRLALDFDAPSDRDWDVAEKIVIQDFIAISFDEIPDSAFNQPELIIDYVDFMFNQQEWRTINI